MEATTLAGLAFLGVVAALHLHRKRRRLLRERAARERRQIAGEDCVECEESIAWEKEATACGVCHGLLHQTPCARRHVCKDAKKPEEPRPYRR